MKILVNSRTSVLRIDLNGIKFYPPVISGALRKIILLQIVLLSGLISNAQIGIGTTSPNSTLDIRGSLSLNYRSFSASTTATPTDNTLIYTGSTAATVTLPDAATCTGRIYSIKNASTTYPLPVLTIATSSAQTIDAGTTWVLNDSKEMISVISDGANWKITGAGPVKTRTNYVLVQSVADFPTPVGGVITLDSAILYEINGTITLTNKIDLNGCTVFGVDRMNDKLVYTPTSGELFTGSKGGTLHSLTLTAPGVGSKIFNLDATANANSTLLLEFLYILNSDNVGLIKGYAFLEVQTSAFSNNMNGVTYENIGLFIGIDVFWIADNHNTYETFTGTFESISITSGQKQLLSFFSAKGVDISGITSITKGASMKNVMFMGDGTYVVGNFSDKWEVESMGITTEKDDVATGNLYLTSTTTTNFSAVNVPTKVLGTTTAVGLFRVSSPTYNQLVYTGTKTRRFAVIGSVSLTAQAANKYFSFYIYKNGVKLPESEQAMRLSTGVDKGSLTISCTVLLTTNDSIEVWAANTSDGSSMTVETLNLTIK